MTHEGDRKRKRGHEEKEKEKRGHEEKEKRQKRGKKKRDWREERLTEGVGEREKKRVKRVENEESE